MIVEVAQRSHCVELTGIMGLKSDKQLTSHIMDASTHGCGEVPVGLARQRWDRHRPAGRCRNKWAREPQSGQKRTVIPPHPLP